MHQGANTILILEVPDVDLTGKQIYATFKALNGKTFTKTEPELDVSDHEIAVHLNQADTLDLPEGPLLMQVRWVEEDGSTGYSDVATIQIDGVMLRNVITYEEDEDT